MNQATGNPYQSPEAQLTNTTNDKSILKFKRFSAWGVFGLSVITLGIYPVYWLYSRATIVNTLHDNKLSSALLISLVIFIVLSLASNFFAGNEMLLIAGGVVNLIYMVLYLVVLFKVKNRLQDIINRSSKTQTILGSILTFFFFSIYLQYKINECIDDVSESA